MQTEEMQKVIAKTTIFYITGFFLTVSPPAIMYLAKHAAEHKKTFCMNLSAPFISQFFSEPLLAALPFVDILFGNESEAKAFGEKMKYEDLSIPAIAQQIAKLPKQDASRPRMVVITQGSDPVIIATAQKIETFNVPPIKKEEIVDTNGAGDGTFMNTHSG